MIAFFGLALTGFARAATNDTEARVFIENLADEAIAALTPTDISRDERVRRARALLRQNFGVETIAQFVLGRHWRTATPDERAEFMSLFEDFVVDTYVDRFGRYTGQKLDVYEVTTESATGDAIVRSQIPRAAAEPIQVGWRVRNQADGLKVIDIYVEGVSLGVTQRSDFASVIRNKGGTISGLLEEMRRRADQTAG
ncbi:MAG: ABC transporter substrate-binding protein [Rhodospirillales bacterium]|nr:ABC transporter substrate-binding protein [Rhodospirillales bacterium]